MKPDNQDLPVTAVLRAVINSGHHCDGTISRCLDGEERSFSTFAPLALAAIGTLPLPILHRSVVFRMERAPNAKLARFDPKTIPRQKADCETIIVKRSNGCCGANRLSIRPCRQSCGTGRPTIGGF